MEYIPFKRQITLNRELNKLDELTLIFTQILKKYTGYVIISGYVSILLGRARATEDIDVFIKKLDKKKFFELWAELENKNFWCLNTDDVDEAYAYLIEGLGIRFAEKKNSIPNFEVKFSKNLLEQKNFEDFIKVKLKQGEVNISSLERQIAIKKYYLKSEKDIEDALHIEELFKDKLDYSKINKIKSEISIILK
ncbi:hypothetical protein J4403_03175 [Candidatus Woesearchaeota archaeon]|nr:hypothetical protein [Candidatus Woesearchaeota archaeon]